MSDDVYPRLVTDPMDGQLELSPLWNLREVAKDLYVGGQLTPLHGDFDTVIDLAGQQDQAYNKFRQVLHLSFRDGLPIPEGLLECVMQAVDEAQGSVLIHCAEGRSRSVSVAYAMLRLAGRTHEEAWNATLSRFGFPVKETFYSARLWVAQQRPHRRLAMIAIARLLERLAEDEPYDDVPVTIVEDSNGWAWWLSVKDTTSYVRPARRPGNGPKIEWHGTWPPREEAG